MKRRLAIVRVDCAAMGSVPQAASVDLSHHINAKSKARHPSPLKDIVKYMGYEGMISLAGGTSVA